NLDILRVCFEGAVNGDATGGHVAGQGQLDHFALMWNVVHAEPLSRNEVNGSLIDLDPGQHLLMAYATAGIGIGLRHQLTDRQHAVPNDVGRHPLGNGRDLAVDHQTSVVASRYIGLDDHQAIAGLRLGDVEGLTYIRIIAQIEHDSAAVVAVEWLEYHGIPDAVGQSHSVVEGTDRLRERDRKPRSG